ncbi:hypothetical protein [Shewanella khirikhana]|nr:hypothetical protein [Shewanella khirikhana]
MRLGWLAENPDILAAFATIVRPVLEWCGNDRYAVTMIYPHLDA